jgi:hypothetical protein
MEDVIRAASPNGDALQQGLTGASSASAFCPAQYDAARYLPKTDMAWEFLRRNPEYRRQVKSTFAPALTQQQDWHGVPVFRQTGSCEAAASWGLIGLCDPGCPAPCDGVFWSALPPHDGLQIVVCRQSGLASGLSKLNPRLLMRLDGRMTLHLRCRARALTLPVSYAPGGLPVPAGFLIPVHDKVSVTAAMRLLRTLQPDRPLHAWTAQRLSLRDALIAFDASAAGLHYREIAALIVGSERVREEWRRDATALKDRVRRAVKRGCRLVEGGYRDLLPLATTPAIASRPGADDPRHLGVFHNWGGAV